VVANTDFSCWLYCFTTTTNRILKVDGRAEHNPRPLSPPSPRGIFLHDMTSLLSQSRCNRCRVSSRRVDASTRDSQHRTWAQPLCQEIRRCLRIFRFSCEGFYKREWEISAPLMLNSIGCCKILQTPKREGARTPCATPKTPPHLDSKPTSDLVNLQGCVEWVEI
jgi:hypothetical protein